MEVFFFRFSFFLRLTEKRGGEQKLTQREQRGKEDRMLFIPLLLLPPDLLVPGWTETKKETINRPRFCLYLWREGHATYIVGSLFILIPLFVSYGFRFIGLTLLLGQGLPALS